MVERERMARRALLAVGSNDGHLAQWLGSRDQALDAVGENPVVVGDQQAHRRQPSVPGTPRDASTSFRSSSRAVSASSAMAPRATALRSPPFLCSSTFCRAPSIVYFSEYKRCF